MVFRWLCQADGERPFGVSLPFRDFEKDRRIPVDLAASAFPGIYHRMNPRGARRYGPAAVSGDAAAGIYILQAPPSQVIGMIKRPTPGQRS